jgi:hypothetical protein
VALSARDRTRFSRHLLLPEIGLAGQERLCATRVSIADGASSAVRETAELYLRRAGLELGAEHAQARAGAEVPSAPLSVPMSSEEILIAVAGQPALYEAAAALLGALSAVETVKGALGLGRAGDPPSGLRLSLLEDV